MRIIHHLAYVHCAHSPASLIGLCLRC